MNVGIEKMNFYSGMACLNVRMLADYRKLDTARFDNLLIDEKSVALPIEDPVSFAINSALPLVNSLSEEEKNSIELLITCTESGIDSGKSISTYLHKYLGLKNNCRLFELKNACYSGTAGLQMAINFILSNTSPNAKALVVATDISRFIPSKGGDILMEDWAYAEPSSGAGSAAVLVSSKPDVFRIDVGANGYYGFEVMDTCRPVPDSEAGNADISLMAYLDCCENAFAEYCKRVENVSITDTFSYLAFHTPFGGMVKGAHRNLMRKYSKIDRREINNDFEKRMSPGLNYCRIVGNVMGATLFLSLISTIDNGDFSNAKRVGCFSYGSGCCSEFFSGIVTKDAQKIQKQFRIGEKMKERYSLTMDEYSDMLSNNKILKYGTRNLEVTKDMLSLFNDSRFGDSYVLKKIDEFHREYAKINEI